MIESYFYATLLRSGPRLVASQGVVCPVATMFAGDAAEAEHPRSPRFDVVIRPFGCSQPERPFCCPHILSADHEHESPKSYLDTSVSQHVFPRPPRGASSANGAGCLSSSTRSPTSITRCGSANRGSRSGRNHVALASTAQNGEWDVRSIERARIHAVRESPGLEREHARVHGRARTIHRSPWSATRSGSAARSRTFASCSTKRSPAA